MRCGNLISTKHTKKDNKMKQYFLIIAGLVIALCASAQAQAEQAPQDETHVSFSTLKNWTTSQLRSYVGQTVVFDQPVYICNNYSGLDASLQRVMSPTNQALPLSDDYQSIVSANNSATFKLSGLSGYHRMGETIYGMRAKITSTSSVTYLSSDKIVGTRDDMLAGLPDMDMVRDEDADTIVKHNLLVCAANLEYYMTEQFGSGSSSSMGPSSDAQHQKQRAKVSAGLAMIGADIYGLVEVQQGQGAMAEIASDLTRLTGRKYSYVDDGGSANGTYTKSGYVYCTNTVETFGSMRSNNTGVSNRKKMQAFVLKSTGEKFIFSINHFKAKSTSSGAGSGADANQNDGQGSYNGTRVQEAQSVLSQYASNSGFYCDEDILIMGDLNAYGKEDPIMTLVNGGMTDLHRYFHADSSYSYTFRGTAGYLDHALANETMLRQITGMAAYHINSDESDSYTYDKSNDQTMFRYSDHDPVVVALRLGANLPLHTDGGEETTMAEALLVDGYVVIKNGEGGHYRITQLDGRCVADGKITGEEYRIDQPLERGFYLVNLMVNGRIMPATKLLVL